MEQKDNELSDFECYLKTKGFSNGSIRTFKSGVKIFLQSNPEADGYGYNQVLSYFDTWYCKELSDNSRKGLLIHIKKYYNFLLEAGRRDDHPCRTLNLPGRINRGIIHSDLFSSTELETLLSREEKFEKVRLKNQVVLSLLIYQGLMPAEVIKLKTGDINLDAGTVNIKGGRVLTSRKLQLHARQILMMDKYLNVARKRLLRTKTDKLIINYRGLADHTDSIQFLVQTCKGMFADRFLTTKTIRDSVISNWLNERKLPLEQVQLLAGHRWISCTERYVEISMDEQREILRKVHPLDI